MSDVAISRIRLDAHGHLRIQPTDPPRFADYEFVYRAGRSIRWDSNHKEHYCLPVQGFTLTDEFAQICKAVLEEYGDNLTLSSNTVYFEMSDDIIEAIKVRFS